MAAKSKKRLSKLENKLLKLEKLELTDVICSICRSILIEPVTLPCYHDFCQRCFNGSIENNALCCPLCRLRIGSWLRTATKQKNLVNDKLWNFMRNKFNEEINKKLKGEDVELSPEAPLLRLSKPGEIRSEYEAELKRLREERLQLEQKHLDKTELLIQKLKKEEDEAQKKYLEIIQQDEILAKQLQNENNKTTATKSTKLRTITVSLSKPRLRPTTIDSFLKKSTAQATITNDNPHLTDDNTSTTDISSPIGSNKSNSRLSPEMLPSYGKLLKNFLDKKNTSMKNWNKENGKRLLEQKEKQKESNNVPDKSDEKSVVKSKIGLPSLLVSLPLPHSSLLNKANVREVRNIETSSVDSMQQELCYFKPIDGNTPTSFNTIKGLPLRVPCIRAEKDKDAPQNGTTPSRDQYIDGLCRLRNLSLAEKLPSAFVIMLGILQVKQSPKKCATYTRSRAKKTLNQNGCSPPSKRSSNRHKNTEIDGITKINADTNLRRTRSMGSISKEDNEVTPKKKARERKFNSDRKPYLRSDSKRLHHSKESCSPPSSTETINNNKVDLAVKNLSSPLENCDVTSILREQLHIEKLIDQEKSDLEFAIKIDAEWNGRRQPRRTATKRQVPLNYALRPAKKLKV